MAFQIHKTDDGRVPGLEYLPLSLIHISRYFDKMNRAGSVTCVRAGDRGVTADRDFAGGIVVDGSAI